MRDSGKRNVVCWRSGGIVHIDHLRTFDGGDVEVVAERGSHLIRHFHQLRDCDASDVIGLEVVRLLHSRVREDHRTNLIALAFTTTLNDTLKCSSK